MRIGILADIHGAVENLARAVDRLRADGVDQFVVLGDVIYDTRNADETVAILRDCGAVGVWGNHELGLCVEPDDEIREMYTPSVMEYFGTLKPSLELGDLYFSHTFPSEDAREVTSYYLAPQPDEEGALEKSFSLFPHRVMMSGHFHRWFAATPEGKIDWRGGEPLDLRAGSRYFVIIHAVADGWTALFDGEDRIVPVRL